MPAPLGEAVSQVEIEEAAVVSEPGFQALLEGNTFIRGLVETRASGETIRLAAHYLLDQFLDQTGIPKDRGQAPPEFIESVLAHRRDSDPSHTEG